MYFTNEQREILRARIEGAGWIGLDDDTKELLRQRDDEARVATRCCPVRYLTDQAGCPKVLT